jgi:hypothetical protein
MDEFYKTRAGRQFIDSTMPRLAEELAKLNDSLDRLIEALERIDCDGSDPGATVALCRHLNLRPTCSYNQSSSQTEHPAPT